jgi:hypothetical protein
MDMGVFMYISGLGNVAVDGGAVRRNTITATARNSSKAVGHVVL